MLQPKHLSPYVAHNTRIRVTNEDGTHAVDLLKGVVGRTVFVEGTDKAYNIKDVKPILKNLTTVSRKEEEKIARLLVSDNFGTLYDYMISRHYDIYELIPAGDALTKKKLKR